MKKIYFLMFIVPFFGFSQWNSTSSWSSQTTANANYGGAISTNSAGTVIAIGSSSNDNFANNQGNVVVHEFVSNTWQQKGSRIYGQIDDQVGISVSLNAAGDIMAIGSRFGGVNNTGSVKIYQFASGNWNELTELTGISTNDEFGIAVALNDTGDAIVIGAITNQPGPGGNPPAFVGYARVYFNINNTWIKVGQDIYGDNTGNSFGIDVDINGAGSIIAIGANNYVRLFDFNINTGLWEQIGNTITSTNNTEFGSEIALDNSGNIIAVGAPLVNPSGTFFARGEVKVYENNSNTWMQKGQTLIGKNVSRDFFGEALSLSDNGQILAVGAPVSVSTFHPDYIGYAQIYQFTSNSWTQIDSDITGNPNDETGTTVALSAAGDKVFVGSPKYDSFNTTNDIGRVQLFENSNVLSANDFETSNIFSIIPNPIKNVFQIETNKDVKSIRIHDLNGRLVLQKDNPPLEINISNLKSGIYFVSLEASSTTQSIKIIKQ